MFWQTTARASGRKSGCYGWIIFVLMVSGCGYHPDVNREFTQVMQDSPYCQANKMSDECRALVFELAQHMMRKASFLGMVF